MLVFNRWLYKVYRSLHATSVTPKLQPSNGTITLHIHNPGALLLVQYNLGPLQQTFIHFIKMTIEFDDKMPHQDYSCINNWGGWVVDIGQWVMAQGSHILWPL